VALIELEEPTHFCTYNPQFRSESAATVFKCEWRRSALGLNDDVGQLNGLKERKRSVPTEQSSNDERDTGSCPAPARCTHARNFVWTSNINKGRLKGDIPALQMVSKL